jgi:hypothetical protein
MIVGWAVMPNYSLDFLQSKWFLSGQDKSSDEIPSLLHINLMWTKHTQKITTCKPGDKKLLPESYEQEVQRSINTLHKQNKKK